MMIMMMMMMKKKKKKNSGDIKVNNNANQEKDYVNVNAVRYYNNENND